MPEEQSFPKQHTFADSPEKLEEQFINSLQDSVNWASNTSEEWAKLKTFYLPKELILFNLGVLAFVSALRDKYLLWVLIIVCIVAFLSIIISFFSIRFVIDENINVTNRKRKVIQIALDKLLRKADFQGIVNEYNVEMALLHGESKGRTRIYSLIYNLPIFLFLASIVFSVLGLIIK